MEQFLKTFEVTVSRAWVLFEMRKNFSGRHLYSLSWTMFSVSLGALCELELHG